MIAVFCSEKSANPPLGASPGWDPAPCWPFLLPWQSPINLYTDLDLYEQDLVSYKIAFYQVNHWPESKENPSISWEEREKNRIVKLSKMSRIVFIMEDEINPGGLTLDHELKNLLNVYWIMPGWAAGLEDRLIPWHYHLWRIQELYKRHLGQYLIKLDPYRPKDFYFDAMLGTRKPHRLRIYQSIIDSGLEHKILYSIGANPGEPLSRSIFGDSAFFVDPDWGELASSDYFMLNQPIRVGRNLYVPMPNLLPISLYNRTAYSIISETWCDNHSHMMTEKLAKALIGRRLFVIFAGAGYLRCLRSQGFCTFGSVIDESYDDELDDKKRWDMAFDQVRRLCEMDQQQVLDRVKPLVDHNYAMIMNRDLTVEPFRQINQIIQKYADQKV